VIEEALRRTGGRNRGAWIGHAPV